MSWSFNMSRIDRSINKLKKQLKMLEITIVDKALHVFERKELRKKISAEEEKLKRAKSQMEMFPAQHGFDSVRDIEQAYREARKEYEVQIGRQEEYNKYLAEIKHRDNQITHADSMQNRGSIGISPADKKETGQRIDNSKSLNLKKREENLSGVNKEVAHRGKNGKPRESILKTLAEKQKQADRRNQENYSRYRSVNRREKDL